MPFVAAFYKECFLNQNLAEISVGREQALSSATENADSREVAAGNEAGCIYIIKELHKIAKHSAGHFSLLACL